MTNIRGQLKKYGFKMSKLIAIALVVALIVNIVVVNTPAVFAEDSGSDYVAADYSSDSESGTTGTDTNPDEDAVTDDETPSDDSTINDDDAPSDDGTFSDDATDEEYATDEDNTANEEDATDSDDATGEDDATDEEDATDDATDEKEPTDEALLNAPTSILSAQNITFTFPEDALGEAVYFVERGSDFDLLQDVTAADEWYLDIEEIFIVYDGGFDINAEWPYNAFTVIYGATHPVTLATFTRDREIIVTEPIVALSTIIERDIYGPPGLSGFHHIAANEVATVTGDVTGDILVEGRLYLNENHTITLDAMGMFISQGGFFEMTDGLINRSTTSGQINVGVLPGDYDSQFVMRGGRIDVVNVSIMCGTFTMHGGYISDATGGFGAVTLNGRGTFNMHGGEIYGHGLSGVATSAMGFFNMYGGRIRNNNGPASAGVILGFPTFSYTLTPSDRITFTMNGGYIHNNTLAGIATHANLGTDAATIIINDGEIYNNETGIRLGGLGVGTAPQQQANVLFTMYGGNIHNNSFAGISSSIVDANMRGGFIQNNRVGVIVSPNAIGGTASGFNMHGGFIQNNVNQIEENNIQSLGGGVRVSGINSHFTMYDGYIRNNTANNGGGIALVHVGSPTTNTINLIGGEISGNTARNNGGGIFTSNFSNITIGGGVEFFGNTAQTAHWLELNLPTTMNNMAVPGSNISSVPINVADLIALHTSDGSIDNQNLNFSASTHGNIRPFTYLANNYDLNFVGANNVGVFATQDVTFDFNFPYAPANETRTIFREGTYAQSIDADGNIIAPPLLNTTNLRAADNYSFVGWFDSVTGEQITNITSVNNAPTRTLEARWVYIGYYQLIIQDVFLAVNDHYALPNHPSGSNEKTFAEIEHLLEASVVNLGVTPQSEINASDFALSAPYFGSIVSFDEITTIVNADGSTTTVTAPFEVIVRADWGTDMYATQVLQVHIVDEVAPVIEVGATNNTIHFYTTTGQRTIQDVLTAANVTVTDNYDSTVPITYTFLGGDTFASINWNQAPMQYSIRLDAADSSGNTAVHQQITIIVSHPPTTIPPDNGGDDNGGDTVTPPPTVPTPPTDIPSDNENDNENNNENGTDNNQVLPEPPSIPYDGGDDDTTMPILPGLPSLPDDNLTTAPPAPGGNNPEIAPITNAPTNTLIASEDGTMWFEFDEDGVPLGAWVWDDATDMWIFDEDVPLAYFPAAPVGAGLVTGVASTLMPQTGLNSLSTTFGLLFIFIAVIAVGTLMLIKQETKKR